MATLVQFCHGLLVLYVVKVQNYPPGNIDNLAAPLVDRLEATDRKSRVTILLETASVSYHVPSY